MNRAARRKSTRFGRVSPERACPTRAPSSSSARPATSPIASSFPPCIISAKGGTSPRNTPSSASVDATGPTRTFRPNSNRARRKTRPTSFGPNSPGTSRSPREASTSPKLTSRSRRSSKNLTSRMERRGTGSITWPSLPSISRSSSNNSARRVSFTTVTRKNLGAASSSKSPSATTFPAPRPSIATSPAFSARIRSTESTTISARRPSKTSSRCGSATRSSNRSGTGRTSNRCRSPWPKRSAWPEGEGAITTPPARSATWSRTT